MSHDELQLGGAGAGPENQKGRRSKWAPGSWAAAAAYNATKPEVRSPIVVGGESMIRTPEELRDLCQLPSAPPLIKTTETTLFPFPEDKESDESKEPVYVADVSLRQWLDIQKVTDGNTVIVWFRGERRSAWLARSAKVEESTGSVR